MKHDNCPAVFQIEDFQCHIEDIQFLKDRGLRPVNHRELSNAFYRSPMPLVIIDQKGTILGCNKEYAQLTNDIICADLRFSLGDNYQEFIAMLGREGKVDRLLAVVQGKHTCCSAHLISQPGRERHYLVTFAPVEFRTVADENIVSVGRITRGIAHDFNNVMTAIIGYGQMCESYIHTRPNDAQRCIQNLMVAAERVQKLAQQVLLVAKHVNAKRKPVSLSLLVQEAASFLRVILPKNVAVFVDDVGWKGTVMADEAQLFQVLVNLGTNASQAMKNGGELKISIRSEGSHVELTVTDTGCGIPKGCIDHILEPHFTTKPDGHGFGLCIVSRIVREHGGTIGVSSKQGRGATFSIRLPLFVEDSQEDIRHAG